MRKALWIAGLVTVLGLSACGGGGGGTTTTCSASGTTLNVVAQNFSFDKSCYAVSAGQPFTVHFDNKDSVPHNFAIYTDSTASKPLSQPPTITATTTSYQVSALSPGTYYFRCDTHTSMNGTFIVK